MYHLMSLILFWRLYVVPHLRIPRVAETGILMIRKRTSPSRYNTVLCKAESVSGPHNCSIGRFL